MKIKNIFKFIPYNIVITIEKEPENPKEVKIPVDLLILAGLLLMQIIITIIN